MSVKATIVSRRAVLAGSGALIFSFSSLGGTLAQDSGGQAASSSGSTQLPGSLKKAPFLDSWIRVDGNRITIFTGKAELGQGIKTALLQIAAEELDAPFDQLTIVTADTARTPNEEYTAGSHSVQDSGTAIRHAAAQVRQLLLTQAATRAGVPADQLRTESAAVIAPDGRRFAYRDLVADQILHVQAASESTFKDPHLFKIMQRPIPRIDIPAKVTGGEVYVQDMRPAGMVHGRVVRPPSYGARLMSVDSGGVEAMPGVIKVVRDGSFLGVIAAREFQAIEAMRALAGATRWEETAQLPNAGALPDFLTAQPSRDIAVLDARQPGSAVETLSATYTRPYIAHGSIGPSCAIAQYQGDTLTVWTHSQGVYPLRNAIAEMLGMPKEQVRCIHAEGAGCYGHNGADDAAADAAVLARAVPGRPVRLQWMREQEHGSEPYGPAMVAKINASLDTGGRIIDWDYAVWSNTHATRPGPAGALIAARSRATAFAQPAPRPIPMPEGDGDRNSIPLYKFPSARVIYHFLPNMPVRVSALRALGAHVNVFAIESFMDELADAAGADPIQFRLRHLDDQRAREVITVAAQRFGWSDKAHVGTPGLGTGLGRGFAFARYKNLAAYCAIACEVEVERDTGRARLVRAVASVDAGQVVNPDGVINQIEGAILQSMSWTLFENVTFDERRITSIDWASYPILRFSAVPDSVEVHIVERPGMPFLGCGEAGQGPAAAAVANAVAAATGRRLRDLPLTRERIKTAMGI